MSIEQPLLPRQRPPSLALFIKTTLRDLQPFLFLQDDLRQFCRITGPVIISVPDAHLAAFRAHVLPGYELISDSAVARAAKVFWPIRDNWYTQQLLKLCASDLIAADAYLVLDGNTVINAEFDEATFQLDGRWVYEIADASEHDLDWELRTWTFLQLCPPNTLGFRTVNQVFERSELAGLRQYLETIYRAPWGDTLYASCECASQLKSVLWTEFQMYGAYISMVSPTRAHALAAKNPLMYFNPKRHLRRMSDVLSWLADHRPLMVKAHRQRPGVRLSAHDYAGVAAAIRTACRGGAPSVG
jgi:hypothetical protein